MTGIELAAGPLRNLTASYEDVQKSRISLTQRGLEPEAEPLKLLEGRLGRLIRRELEKHPVWPWLSQYPGLGGVHTARLIALIEDPHRFPGRKCEAGHYHSAVEALFGRESTNGCGVELVDGTVCAAPVGPLRRGTGTRSLWRYLGLDVDESGRSPRKRKGVRHHWNPAGRTAILMPGGIAEHIVRSRVPYYRDIYDQHKERLSKERSVVSTGSDAKDGPLDGAEAGTLRENGMPAGLRPVQIDHIARKIAAKAFVADLLAEWKRVTQPVTSEE